MARLPASNHEWFRKSLALEYNGQIPISTQPFSDVEIPMTYPSTLPSLVQRNTTRNYHGNVRAHLKGLDAPVRVDSIYRGHDELFSALYGVTWSEKSIVFFTRIKDQGLPLRVSNSECRYNKWFRTVNKEKILVDVIQIIFQPTELLRIPNLRLVKPRFSKHDFYLNTIYHLFFQVTNRDWRQIPPCPKLLHILEHCLSLGFVTFF